MFDLEEMFEEGECRPQMILGMRMFHFKLALTSFVMQKETPSSSFWAPLIETRLQES